MPKLNIELVPAKAWFVNLRSILTPKRWDIIRKTSYRIANYKCEICGGKGNKHPVECHEIWEYNDSKHTQTLMGVMALCPACHQVKHFGLSELKGKKEACLAHLAKINGWKVREAEDYVEKCFALWEKRSQHEWQIAASSVNAPTSKLQYMQQSVEDFFQERPQITGIRCELTKEALHIYADGEVIMSGTNTELKVFMEGKTIDELIKHFTEAWQAIDGVFPI